MIVRSDPSIGAAGLQRLAQKSKVPGVSKQKRGNEDEKLFRESSFMHLFSGERTLVLTVGRNFVLFRRLTRSVLSLA